MAGIGDYEEGKPFSLKSGNKPAFKVMGSSVNSPNNLNNFGIGKGTSPYRQTDAEWEKMRKESVKNDPGRYGSLTLEDYKTEAKRQSKSKKETGSWDVNNKNGEKIEETNPDAGETNVTETAADKITADVETPKVNKRKTGLGKVGGILSAGFTSGLDAVYGTGKVIPSRSKVIFSDKKEKKDDKKELTGQEKVKKILND